MSASNPLAFAKYFSTLKDPRVRRRSSHRLLDILAIALCAVLCGANTWPEIEAFGKRRHAWLQRFLPLSNGIPSHDTFERVFDRLHPEAFLHCFGQWVEAISVALGLEHIAIDGKTLRHSGAAGLGPLHVVSAWATEHHLSLGQVAVEEKSNEITAIPKLLELLELHGALITIDAMGCQKAIAQKIVAGGGDYVLTVKENQGHLLEDIRAAFARALETDFAGLEHDEHETDEAGHGRREYRCYHVIHDPEGLRHQEAWEGLTTIGLCYSERTVGGETSYEARYFIGSFRGSARAYGKFLRNHWRIENCLHWQLDVTFREDASTLRKRNGAENFALLRRMALAMLKRYPGKGSMACKRLEAALDTQVLEAILRG